MAALNDRFTSCVIDANVAIKLVIAQPDSDVAQSLFDRLADDPSARFHVPDFFFAECASTLVNYVRLSRYPIAIAQQGVRRLIALRVRATPALMLAASALDIATECRITGYDACYVALSHQIDAPLITADEKLVTALVGQPYQVLSLAALRA